MLSEGVTGAGLLVCRDGALKITFLGPWPFVEGVRLLLWGEGRGIDGESFRYLADSAGVHFGGAGILNASDSVSVEAGSFGKLTLREERSLSGPSYFLPIYLHDREHLRPPVFTRRISSRFSSISR
jgi:hypothetical protein